MRTFNKPLGYLLLFPIVLALFFIILQGSASKELKNQEPPPPKEEIKPEKVVLKKEVMDAHEHAFTIPRIPKDVDFCGERVPFEDRNVLERMEREILVNSYWHSSTFLMLKRTSRYFGMIEKILEEEGVPSDFKYLALAESGLQPVKSGAGAQGVWQFIKTTGSKNGLEIRKEVDERYHVAKATHAACNYLKRAKSRFGTWTLAAAAYNRGEAGLSRALSGQRVKGYYDLYLNSETSRYVFRIIALKLIHQNPEAFNLKLDDWEYYQPISAYSVEVDTSVKSLPQFALDHGTTYKILREMNPWLRSYSLSNSKHKKYYIELPFMESERIDE